MDPWIAMRGALARHIWPATSALPTDLPTVTEGTSVGYGGVGDPYCAREDTLHCPFPAEITVTDGGAGYGIARLYHPLAPIGRAVVVLPGHNELDYTSTNWLPFIASLLLHGYHVLAACMPLVELSLFASGVPLVVGDGLHTALVSRVRSYTQLSPLRLFLDTPIIAINHVIATLAPDSVDVVGFSGGGWTVDFLAAVDTRIRNSYCVLGSMPFAIRDILVAGGVTSANGDGEQLRTNEWWGLLNGEEESLYTLGCYDAACQTGLREPRRRVQIVADGDNSWPATTVHAEIAAYTAVVAARVRDGAVETLYDPDAVTHEVTSWARSTILADL